MTDLKFKAGDHVMVPMKIKEADNTAPPGYVTQLDNEQELWLVEAALASATLIERPLAVGDRVTWRASASALIYTLSSIDGDLAVVRGPGGAWLTPLSELRRAEERG